MCDTHFTWQSAWEKVHQWRGVSAVIGKLQDLHLREFPESWYRMLGCVSQGLSMNLSFNSKNNVFQLSHIFAKLYKSDRITKYVIPTLLCWPEKKLEVMWVVFFVFFFFFCIPLKVIVLDKAVRISSFFPSLFLYLAKGEFKYNIFLVTSR